MPGSAIPASRSSGEISSTWWPEHPPREKGIDVALAIDLVHSALREEYVVAVVFTNDTDILPAVELAFYETEPRIEIAAWQGAKPLWFPAEISESADCRSG